MEEPLLFNGSLNKADTNTPEGDYSDARNIVLSEDDQGSGGAFKKMRSITSFADLSEFGAGVGIVASTIDEDGNQYHLVHSNAIKETSMSIASFPASAAGKAITQGSAKGWIYDPQLSSPATSTVKILQTSATDLADGTVVIDGNNYTASSTTVGSAKDVAFLVKVTSASVVSIVFAYELTETPSVTPDLVFLGDSLIWNYLYGGVPMSYYIPRRFYYGTSDGASGFSYNDSFLAKSPPTGVSLDSTDDTSNGLRYLFEKNTYVIAARFVYDSGETSALSTPLTLIAGAESDLPSGDDEYDSVDVSLLGTIPPTVSTVEWYASVNGGSFRRAASKDASGSTDLTFIGELNEILSTTESTKLFDSIPVSANAVESIKNRLFLANMTDDLPLEAASVSLSITAGVATEDFTAGNNYCYGASGGTSNDTPVEKSLASGSEYNLGVIFMDEKFRTRGVVPSSVTKFSTSDLSTTNNRIKSISMTITTAPSWAVYAQVVATRNLSKDFVIESYANGIFYQIEEISTGNLFFMNAGGTSPNGIAASTSDFKVRSIVIDPNTSYTFQSGDFVQVYGDDGSIYELEVNSYTNGLIYCSPNDNVISSKVGAQNNYIQIYSPKDTSSEENFLYYETGHIVKVADAGSPHVFYEGGSTNNFGKRIYDSFWTKGEVDEPLFRKHIDSDLDYSINGSIHTSGSPFIGLPVFNSGAAVFAKSDTSQTTSTSGTQASIPYLNGLHTNDPRETISDVYHVVKGSHGHADGDIVQMDSGTATANDKQRVIKVLGTNNYIASITCRVFTVSSVTGFTAGDQVSINTSQGIDTGYIVNINGSNIYVSGMRVKYAHLAIEQYSTISNGTTTIDITALVSYTPPFDSAYGSALSAGEGYSNRLLYSEDKIYACGYGQGSSYGVGIFTNYVRSSRMPGNLSTFDSAATVAYLTTGNGRISGVCTPRILDANGNLDSGKKYILQFYAKATASVGNTEAITLSLYDYTTSLSLFPELSATSIAIGATGEISGTIILDNLLGSHIAFFSVYSASGGQSYTLHKNSFIHIEEYDEASNMQVIPRSWGKSCVFRSLNKREDDFTTWDRPYGRPIIEDTEYSPKTNPSKLRWGARFIEDAQLNPISSFNSSDQEFTPQEAGPITKLIRTSRRDETGSVLLAICEREANSIYVGERIVTNNDGSQDIIASDSVVGSIQPLQGNWGTKHKRSVSRDNSGGVVWWDDYNRDMVRYTRGGLVPISDYKMKPYFQSKSGEFVSFYDKFHDLYFFSNATAGESVSFSQGDLMAQRLNPGWKSLHDFTFTLGGEQFNDYSYPIKGSVIYRTLGSSFGSYFGSTQQAYIVLSKFSPVNFDLMSIRLRGQLVDLSTYAVRDIDIVITNDMGQQTSLDEGFFVIEGSYIFSDIYRDENSAGGLSEGLPMIASNAKVKILLNSDTTISQYVPEVYLNFEPASF